MKKKSLRGGRWDEDRIFGIGRMAGIFEFGMRGRVTGGGVILFV
jgi:hypothetical protein